MSQVNVLIADPDERTRRALATVLVRAGHRVDPASDASEVIRRARSSDYDLLLLDLNLPLGEGLELLQDVKRLCPSMLVAVTSAKTSVETVISAFRRGAHDYLVKPILPGKMIELTNRARTLRDKGERRRRLSEELEHERLQTIELRRQLASADPFHTMVGSSPAMRSLIESLREVARTDSTVLLTGETGTGKGLAARAIHEASDRSAGPFVEANCVVYSEGVLQSELFGHEKGAFTGAARQKKGRFELARGGTLFLNEIGEISPSTQLLLLRVLEDRTFERVGGEETLDVDVRLIAATNRELHEAMRRGEFRSDLFFRLNVIPVHVPPLREHLEDVPALAQHFLRVCAARLGREVEGFTSAAMGVLAHYDWPGNVRELENVVERTVVLCRSDRIDVEELPPALRDHSRRPTTRAAAGNLRDLERQRIQEVMRETGGNKKLAARKLGIHRSTLYAKLKRYGLMDPKAAGRRPRSDLEREVSDLATDLGTSRAVGS